MKKFNQKLLTFLLVTLALTSVSLQGCFKKSNVKSPYTWTENPIDGDIPKNFSWGDVDGVNYLSQLRNQFTPGHCGSCWTFGTTSAFSDRIAIMRKNAFPEINISPQVLLDCDQKSDGCHGGDHNQAFQWMHDNFITDESCAPYTSQSWKEGRKCTDESICKECAPGGKGCFVPKKYNKYHVGKWGTIPQDVAAIQNEIYANGPVTCSINIVPMWDFRGTSVFKSDDTTPEDHCISLVGWGETDDGTPYWIMRNSFGEYWGDNGYAKVFRGNNTLQIEQFCTYAIPLDTWSEKIYPYTKKVEHLPEWNGSIEIQPWVDPSKIVDEVEKTVEQIEKTIKLKAEDMLKQLNIETSLKKYQPVYIEEIDSRSDVPEEIIVSAQPSEYMSDEELPESFTWQNEGGINYLSWIVNQHVPQYCGSCWAQAAMSAFADRVNIINKNAWPRVAFAVQQILNCEAGGSCEGGSLNGPYNFGHKNAFAEFGCLGYLALDPTRASCDSMQNCKTCKNHSGCIAVTDWPKWYVKEYGRLTGDKKMKKEIYSRGPLTCGMHVTDKFYNEYTGGIWKESVLFPTSNHAISVVGWGVENGEEYWIVRNSWGSQWGENGFFRIDMHHGNLGIGKNSCYWAVPTQQKP